MITVLAALLSAPGDVEFVRRQTLRLGLRGWRAAIDPATVDVPRRARRGPGLTREDVAELAGLSLRWYALFESGSPKHRFSPRSVDRIADALRLSDVDRAMLQMLANREAFRSVRLIARSSVIAETALLRSPAA